MKKIFLVTIIYLFKLNPLFGLIEVDITRGNLDPLPIAVSPLHVDINSEKSNSIKIKELGINISEIIEKNFRNTGLFNPLNRDSIGATLSMFGSFSPTVLPDSLSRTL